MKLQPKIEINNLVASQKKLQIDEGIRIAQKVDALRRTLADLQTQHENFIAGMEGELRKRTDHLISQVANLERDVAELEDRKRLAQIPLDDGWKALKEEKARLGQFRVNLEQKETKIEQKALIQDERDRKSKELMVQVKSRDRASIKANEEAEALKLEGEQILKQAQIEKERIEQGIKEEVKELRQKEKALTSYEFSLKNREEQIQMKEQEIIKTKLQLADQRKTLERAMKRLQK